MEKLSNNRTDYWNQIKSELLDSTYPIDFRFRYLEMGQLLTHGFSCKQLDSNPNQLILKIWNPEFDNKRFDKGIYNLDRLAINERIIDLNSKEINSILTLLNKELCLTDWDGIVLDGLLCQFEYKDKKIEWNCNKEINKHLIKLIGILRNKVTYTIT